MRKPLFILKIFARIVAPWNCLQAIGSLRTQGPAYFVTSSDCPQVLGPRLPSSCYPSAISVNAKPHLVRVPCWWRMLASVVGSTSSIDELIICQNAREKRSLLHHLEVASTRSLSLPLGSSLVGLGTQPLGPLSSFMHYIIVNNLEADVSVTEGRFYCVQ